MTTDIDAAITELELCQFELEQMEEIMNDKTDCGCIKGTSNASPNT